MMFERRKQEMSRGQMCIAHQAREHRPFAGWSYMHEMLRFRADSDGDGRRD
jgi:hypothetical protein